MSRSRQKPEAASLLTVDLGSRVTADLGSRIAADLESRIAADLARRKQEAAPLLLISEVGSRIAHCC
jgi:hypothetical protein